MSRKRFQAVLPIICLLFGIRASADPALICEGCTGEVTPVLSSRGEPLKLHEQPDASSRVVAILTVPKGKKIEAKRQDFRVITRKAAVIRVDAAHSFEAYTFGDRSFITEDSTQKARLERFAVNPGDSIGLLLRGSRGACFLRIGKETVVSKDCDWLSSDAAEVQPDIEWWIRLGPGWIRLDGDEPLFEQQSPAGRP